jgi:DNA-directed RNA polymerase specialized sigma24 family protein
MSEQIAGRFGRFVNWLDQWRGGPHSDESCAWLDIAEFDSADEVDELPGETAVAVQLKAAVEQLTSHERHVLLLHVNGGMTYWEIAGQLGMAEQAVLNDLSRAYSRLRVRLSVEEQGPAPARVGT